MSTNNSQTNATQSKSHDQLVIEFFITLLLGWLGIHKFMQKKNKLGLLYLFTYGLFFFGWFFDVIIALFTLAKYERKVHSNIEKSSRSESTGFGARYTLKNGKEIYAINIRPDDYIILKQIYTKVVGVTYKNEDGTKRQEILESCRVGQQLVFDSYDHNGSTAYAVYDIMGNRLGHLSASLATDIYDFIISYENKTDDTVMVYGEITEITGGDGLKYGCNIIVYLLVCKNDLASEAAVLPLSSSEPEHVLPKTPPPQVASMQSNTVPESPKTDINNEKHTSKNKITALAFCALFAAFFILALATAGENGGSPETTPSVITNTFSEPALEETTSEITVAQETTQPNNEETTASPITSEPEITTTAPETTFSPETTAAPEITASPEETSTPETTAQVPITTAPATTPAETTPQNPGRLQVIEVESPVRRGTDATLKIKGKPNTEYSITVYYDTIIGTAKGLVDKVSDDNGNVTWIWRVGSKTTPGIHTIVISGGGETIETYFETTD